MAGVASVFGELERRLISQQTRDALAAKLAEGVRLGRPRVVGDDARDRILELRDWLPRGGTWPRRWPMRAGPPPMPGNG